MRCQASRLGRGTHRFIALPILIYGAVYFLLFTRCHRLVERVKLLVLHSSDLPVVKGFSFGLSPTPYTNLQDLFIIAGPENGKFSPNLPRWEKTEKVYWSLGRVGGTLVLVIRLESFKSSCSLKARAIRWNRHILKLCEQKMLQWMRFQSHFPLFHKYNWIYSLIQIRIK